MAFVSGLRFTDDEARKADVKEVVEIAGGMPESDSLSETKMLEIKKK